ncbi:MAG: L,D-transpeptidase family protein [Prosthecobacter sp.]
MPVSGNPKIVISLSEQRVALFKGDQLVGISPISSGREEHGTHVGNFSISEKDENHRSSLYGAYVDASGNVVVEDVDVRKTPKPPGTRFLGADMHWFMRVNGAIGMHRGYLPGYPASHGCIRLPGAMASLFYHATPYGTPVEIRRNASLIALQPRNAPSLAVTEKVSITQAPASKAAQPKPAKSMRPGTTLYWDGIQ